MKTPERTGETKGDEAQWDLAGERKLLEPHRGRLLHWFGVEDLTAKEVVEELKKERVCVSVKTLQYWLGRNRGETMQVRLLNAIRRASRQSQEVSAELEKHPAPELETIASLHRVVAFDLARLAIDDRAVAEVSAKMTKLVLEIVKVQAWKAEQELDARHEKGEEEEGRRMTAEEKEAEFKRIFGIS